MSKFIKWKTGYQCGNCNWFWGTKFSPADLEKIGQFCRRCGHACSNTVRPGHDIIYRWVPTWRWFSPQTWKRGYFEVQRVLGPEDKQYFTKQGHRISKEKAINPSIKSVTFKQT